MRDSKGRFIKGSNGWLGRKHTEETKLKQRLVKLGKYPTEATRVKLSLSRQLRNGKNAPTYGKHINLGENNNQWKGDKVRYHALHEWVRNHLSKPDLCQMCNKDKKLDLANITGEYDRYFKNWLYLCRSCHMKWDN